MGGTRLRKPPGRKRDSSRPRTASRASTPRHPRRRSPPDTTPKRRRQQHPRTCRTRDPMCCCIQSAHTRRPGTAAACREDTRARHLRWAGRSQQGTRGTRPATPRRTPRAAAPAHTARMARTRQQAAGGRRSRRCKCRAGTRHTRPGRTRGLAAACMAPPPALQVDIRDKDHTRMAGSSNCRNTCLLDT